AAMFQCARSWVQSFTGLGSEDFDDFVAQQLEDGRWAASFFKGSFAEALAAAEDPQNPQSEGRGLVLLWLHGKDDAATARLCREVLADGFVASELATRWLPWAADTCRHEGASLAQAVAVSSAPALVLIRAVPQGSPGAMEYPSGCFFRVLSILTGTIGAQQLLYLLKAEAERADLEQSLRLQWQQQLGHMERVSQNVA
ncbi:unnamed protein product, partial [Effrenium voratum]